MESTHSLRDSHPIPSGRIDYLDFAKGIFIILILALHHLNGAESLKRYLYSMGVTPFFLISGFLYAHRTEWEQPFGSMCIRKIRKFLYPFFTFSVINLLWNVLYYKVVFPSSVPEISLKEMFVHTITTYGYNALWYLPCILWGTLLFFALRRMQHHDWIFGALSVGLVFFYILFDQKLTGLGLVSYLYSYLLRTAVAAVFLYAGSVLYCVFQKLNNSRENLLLLCCLVFSVVIALLYQLYPEQFPTANLAVHQLGNPYVYYLKAISNTTVILLICRKLSGRIRMLAYFGKNSLILMALHMDVTIKIAWWIFPKLPIDFGEVINSVIIIAMELLMFAVMIPIINRYFPFILRYPQNEKIGC